MIRLALAALLLALPAAAGERPVPPSEFRALAEGWTLHFEHLGAHYGSEVFRGDGRTTWQYRDGTCVDGRWEAHGAQLCFTYEDGRDERLCWRFLEDAEGYLARLLGDGPDAGLELRLSRRDREPLLCGNVGA
jgi:hypothetical protein